MNLVYLVQPISAIVCDGVRWATANTPPITVGRSKSGSVYKKRLVLNLPSTHFFIRTITSLQLPTSPSTIESLILQTSIPTPISPVSIPLFKPPEKTTHIIYNTLNMRSNRFNRIKNPPEVIQMDTFNSSPHSSLVSSTDEPLSNLSANTKRRENNSLLPKSSFQDHSIYHVNNSPSPSNLSFDDPINDFSSQTANESSSNNIRLINFNEPVAKRKKYPSNKISNNRYNIITFLPKILYEQFKYFLNLYFLVVALSQFIPKLKIGYTITYVGPLIFVLFVTMLQELYDDYLRRVRDNQVNSQTFPVLRAEFNSSFREIPSSKILVGDFISITKNQRIPADIILLKTTEQGGSCFVRTDQLDGETDWKHKTAVSLTQNIDNDLDLLSLIGQVEIELPRKDIYSFSGNVTANSILEPENPNTDFLNTQTHKTVGIDVNNTIWKDMTLASGSAIGFVIYTGKETRSEMNTSLPRTKIGILDGEVNFLTKILFIVTLVISFFLVLLDGFRGSWLITMFRFLILFSSIIPISLRVNLDLGKAYYGYQIQHDSDIPDTIVRTSSIPEELGRLEYLVTDKTGTLTCNEMRMMRIHLGNISYNIDTMDEVRDQLEYYKNMLVSSSSVLPGLDSSANEEFHNISFDQYNENNHEFRAERVKQTFQVAECLALCHNVTPTTEVSEGSDAEIITSDNVEYTASSPDEIAIVEWTSSVGLTLIRRSSDGSEIDLDFFGIKLEYHVLDIIPFTSESKRMGIVIRNLKTNEISFIQKGADSVMLRIINRNDWVEEEVSNMAREGLRTLIVGRKVLQEHDYLEYKKAMDIAKQKMQMRKTHIEKVISEYLEFDLDVLCVTGVEDKLQPDVQTTLEQMRNAGFKIWMLTGDKVETAICIAISTKLVEKTSRFKVLSSFTDHLELKYELDMLSNLNHKVCLVIDGQSLQLCLENYPKEFVEIAAKLECVVCCRCSPTQKGEIVVLIQKVTKRLVVAIGDGGNDVGMIQVANVGIGLM
ncbi:putative phospholipid-transporting ATPase IIB, partial [Smittium mucronatum]